MPYHYFAVISDPCLPARSRQSENNRERFTACPEIDSFVTAAALRYPACRILYLEVP